MRVALRPKRRPLMTKVSKYCWYNGDLHDREDGAPSIASISFHLGTGVFDGIMAYWNCDHYYIHRAEDHLVRFCRGAERMGLTFHWSPEQMMAGINDLLSAEPTETQYIRPIAYRRAPELWVTGSEGRPVDVSIFTVRTDGHRDIDDPISCQISPVERISSRSIPAQTKVSGSYVNSFHARRLAEKSGYDDGIMLDREGRLAEASAANVFVVSGERVLTPPLNSDVFPGITRKVLLELAGKHGVEAREVDLRADDLMEADGVFLCSTLMEIRGVSRIGERSLRTLDLPVYKTLVNAFRSMTHQ